VFEKYSDYALIRPRDYKYISDAQKGTALEQDLLLLRCYATENSKEEKYDYSAEQHSEKTD
jgi:hypothetical protein